MELVIINPLTAEIHPERRDHPFKHVPSIHYLALLWGRLNKHPSIPPLDDAEKIADCIRLLAVPLGCLPDGAMIKLYADYYESGGYTESLPYWLSRREAEEYIKTHFSDQPSAT